MVHAIFLGILFFRFMTRPSIFHPFHIGQLRTLLKRLLLLGFFSSTAFADPTSQDILVSAPRILDESTEASRSVNIIDEQEIRIKKPLTVADLLADLPGVEVARQGAVGQPTSVFIRGARSEDTLVLIDGVAANDAMSPACGFDFASLSAENIVRIDVYRGPQSVRFGAGALGGVINIVTKEGVGPAHARYGFELGSYDTSRAMLGISGRTRNLGYSFAMDGLNTQGFSAAAAQDGNSEPDGAKIGTTSTKITWSPDPVSKIDASFRYTKANVDLDRHGGPGGDDPNDTGQDAQFISSLIGQRRFLSGELKSNIGFYYSEVRRSDTNAPDPENSDNSSDSFLSETQKLDSNHELFLGENHLLRIGLQWQRESGTTFSVFDGAQSFVPRKEQSITGEALTYVYETATWFGDLGARADEQSKIGLIPSARASVGRSFPQTKTRLTAAYGTGFKIPSLYQLYSTYGDQNLRWESSDTYELTAEQKFRDHAAISLSYFRNVYRSMIDFDMATSKYLNISAARSQGFELQGSVQASEEINIVGNYTYLDTEDESTGLSLLRRPNQAANFNVRYARGALGAFVQAHYESERPDVDPVSFIRIHDPAYAILSLGGSYQLSPLFKIHFRIENLLNRIYEQVAGYGTPGRSFYVGLSGDI